HPGDSRRTWSNARHSRPSARLCRRWAVTSVAGTRSPKSAGGSSAGHAKGSGHPTGAGKTPAKKAAKPPKQDPAPKQPARAQPSALSRPNSPTPADEAPSPTPGAAPAPEKSGDEGDNERVDELLAAAVGAVPSGVTRPGQRLMAQA